MASVTGDPVVASMLSVASATTTVMRDVAHELRQPLGTIESIAYYLALVLPRDDEKTHDQLRRVQDLVGQAEWILSNALHLTETLRVTPLPADVTELITEVIASKSWPAECAPLLEFAADLPLVRIDPGLGRVLLGNLLMLFRLVSTESEPTRIRTCVDGARVAVEMQTSARGYRSESSLGPGGSLSLGCARRIVAAHGGSLDCSVEPISRVRVGVMLP